MGDPLLEAENVIVATPDLPSQRSKSAGLEKTQRRSANPSRVLASRVAALMVTNGDESIDGRVTAPRCTPKARLASYYRLSWAHCWCIVELVPYAGVSTSVVTHSPVSISTKSASGIRTATLRWSTSGVPPTVLEPSPWTPITAWTFCNGLRPRHAVPVHHDDYRVFGPPLSEFLSAMKGDSFGQLLKAPARGETVLLDER
jgi:hypothetical protein